MAGEGTALHRNCMEKLARARRNETENTKAFEKGTEGVQSNSAGSHPVGEEEPSSSRAGEYG